MLTQQEKQICTKVISGISQSMRNTLNNHSIRNNDKNMRFLLETDADELDKKSIKNYSDEQLVQIGLRPPLVCNDTRVKRSISDTNILKKIKYNFKNYEHEKDLKKGDIIDIIVSSKPRFNLVLKLN